VQESQFKGVRTLRLLNIAAMCFAISSAFLLYGLSYETRRLETHVQEQERAAEKAKGDIAVLKAERSHLTRPERIDPIARQLGMIPPRPDQLVSPGVVSALPDQALPEMPRLAEGE
jgi:cell division protein FtsL